MVAVMTSLDKLVDAYLQDIDFQQEREAINTRRQEIIQAYESLAERFVDRTLGLSELHNGLNLLRRSVHTTWGGHSADLDLLLAELSKLVRYHAPINPDIEANFRFILRDLNPQNIGQCIGRCYSLFTTEKQRLENGKFVPPGHSALLISLFACWLGAVVEPCIYSSSMRDGLSALIKAKFLLAPANIKLGQRIEIKSANDYQTVVNLLDLLAANQPRIKTDAYWSEHFFVWLRKQLKKNPTFLNNISVTIEVDLEDEGTIMPLDDDAFSPPIDYVVEPAIADFTKETLQDRPLQATPEPLLSQLIAEVRKHILADEKVVRDIYYALLGGHLILTGPPGTGKTELARLIPEILWQCEIASGENGSNENTRKLSAHTAYTTTLVTATAEWSTRTLISSIMPVVQEEKVAYYTQHGHLVQAILCNWGIDPHRPEQWEQAQRVGIAKTVALNGHAEDAQPQQFQGHWLIIDEFNRAPIEIALGEAMTALSNGDALQITLNGQVVKLPIPKDFRIIGTLNSFDRHHVQTIGEALKRRFSFVEILPPSREQCDAEQTIVLYKALRDVAHLDQDRIKVSQGRVYWEGIVLLSVNEEGIYQDKWDEPDGPFLMLFHETLWPLFEVLRIYRQLGTAQIIALTRQVLMRGILEGYTDHAQWRAALDTALTTVIADQLQVILSDELGILLWRLRLNKQDFLARYYQFLDEISAQPKRFARHLEALQRIVHTTGEQLLSDETIEHLLDEEEETAQLIHELLTTNLLSEAFHLDAPLTGLPQFTRRLRTFKAEHGL